MISCNEAVSQLWDYVERSLTAEDKAQIENHIAVCRECCGEAEFAGQLRGFLDTHAENRIPPEARRRLDGFLTELDTTTT